MKKHEISSEYFEQVLEKSKNKAHEIDNGEEPNNDDAECPPSLCDSGSSEKSESSESSESASMEDQPLQGDNDSDTEKEETEEDKDEDEDSEEDEYEFKKSEACGHTIEYKRIAKAVRTDKNNIEFRHSNESGSSSKQSDAQQRASGITRQASLEDQSKGQEAKRDRQNKERAHHEETGEKVGTGKTTTREESKGEEARVEGRRSHKAPKYTGPDRRKKKRVRGDGHIYKAESGMHTVEYKTLEKNRMATKEELATLNNKKKGKDFPRPRGVDDLVEKKPEKKVKPSSDHVRPRGVDDLAASEDSKVEETKGIDFDKEQDADKTKEEKKGIKRPLEKCGEIKKEEMDKCGDMTSGKKLKKFMVKSKK
jgi:hypothetical protein